VAARHSKIIRDRLAGKVAIVTGAELLVDGGLTL
jgi:hypothetical protein